MPTAFIVLRDAPRARLVQARLEASREWRVLGITATLYRARQALPKLDPDALLIDLRLEDGAALSLVHQQRKHRSGRPRIMLLAADTRDPLLFSTLTAGAQGYLLDTDLASAPAALLRMMAGEAAMASALARLALQFFGEMPAAAREAVQDDRTLDWHTDSANPLRLSPGERRLVQMLAQDMRSAEVAARTALSVEAVGRRIGVVYRKLQWDVNSGSLAMLAA